MAIMQPALIVIPPEGEQSLFFLYTVLEFTQLGLSLVFQEL